MTAQQRMTVTIFLFSMHFNRPFSFTADVQLTLFCSFVLGVLTSFSHFLVICVLVASLCVSLQIPSCSRSSSCASRAPWPFAVGTIRRWSMKPWGRCWLLEPSTTSLGPQSRTFWWPAAASGTSVYTTTVLVPLKTKTLIFLLVLMETCPDVIPRC